MFTIDLLKGQGRPVRTKPQGVAIFVATFAVPVLIAMLMAGYYTRNGVLISVYKQNISNLDLQIKRLDDAIKFKESSEKEKANAKNCLADVAVSVKSHSQWSLVLAALLENLPDSVVLNGLEVKRTVLRGKAVAAVSTDKKNAVANVSVRTLKMRVSGNPAYNCDLEVKAFRDRLKASKYLGNRLEDVVIASQGHDTVDGRDVVAYDIDCIFKAGM